MHCVDLIAKVDGFVSKSSDSLLLVDHRIGRYKKDYILLQLSMY